jgi:hypothetical protein
MKSAGLANMHTELYNMHAHDGLNTISWTGRRPTASVFQVSVCDIMVQSGLLQREEVCPVRSKSSPSGMTTLANHSTLGAVINKSHGKTSGPYPVIPTRITASFAFALS